MFTMRAKGLLHFDSDYELTNQKCLTAKSKVEALLNRPFFILINNTLTSS